MVSRRRRNESRGQGLCAQNSLSGKSVSSPDPKNISLLRLVETALLIPTVPPHRGAYRDRHGRGEGCGGRGSVLRATGLQGGSMRPVSDQQHADEGCCSVRQNRVVLTPRRWRQVRGVEVGPTGLRQKHIRRRRWQKSPVTGESATYAVKTIACGNAG